MVRLDSRCWLLLCALAGCGCATVQPHLAPTPAILKDPRLRIASTLPQELRSTRLPVFFATTRAPTAGPEHFANADGGGVTLGVAQVRLGDPGWTWDDLLASDRTSSVDKPRIGAVEAVDVFGHAGVAGATSDADRAFVAAIDAQLGRARNQELVLYVHGYRVAFDEVAVQMGSFSHFLGQGAVVTFQWPTGMMFWNYFTDCPRAQAYIPDIERMLTLVARTRAANITVMAYSCGSPLLAAALASLRARHPDLDHAALLRRYRLGNVIFVASDIDLKTFARDHVQPALDLAQQVIVYVSRNDRALDNAAMLAGASRLGGPDLADLTPADLRRLAADPRFQAIDVSDVRGAHEMGGMRGHGYWYANEIVSTDVTMSLRFTLPPDQRCLVNEPGTRIWRIPDGYLDCLVARMLAQQPALGR